MSTTVYVGPFLRVDKKYESVERKIRACVNPDCKKAQKPVTTGVNFCSDCGKDIQEVVTHSQLRVDLYDVFDRDEPFFEAMREFGPKTSTMVLLPNRGKHLIVINHNDNDNLFDFTNLDTGAAIDQLKADFAKEIEVLTRCFGEVEFGWGVISHTS